MSIEAARIQPGSSPTAAQHNLLVREVIARRAHIAPVDEPTDDFQHCWKVTRRRISGQPLLWRVDVGAGCVNDRPAYIRYRTEGDPRDTGRFDSPPPVTNNTRFTDRNILNARPPWLLVTTPTRNLKSMGDFNKVSPAQRPRFFRTRARWNFDLYRSGVYVRGTRPALQNMLLDIPFMPVIPSLVGLTVDLAYREIIASIAIGLSVVRLQALAPPYLLTAGKQGLLLDGQEVYRIAHLWLMRKPDAPPENDVLYVEQTCTWSLQAFSVIEDQGLLSILPLLQATGDIGNLTAHRIFETLIDAAQIRWWSK